MIDLISREQAIRFLELKANKPGSYGYLDTKTIAGLLKSLPSAEPQWISTTDRLPESSGMYLVCVQFPVQGKDYIVTNYEADLEAFGCWIEYFDYETLATTEREFQIVETVIAWMPLPGPYKEENDDQHD